MREPRRFANMETPESRKERRDTIKAFIREGMPEAVTADDVALLADAAISTQDALFALVNEKIENWNTIITNDVAGCSLHKVIVRFASDQMNLMLHLLIQEQLAAHISEQQLIQATNGQLPN